MRSALAALAATVIFTSVGCLHHNTCSCQGGAGGPAYVGRLAQGHHAEEMGPVGPPSASYAYPYYTTRAPRDFLQDNPMGIGP